MFDPRERPRGRNDKNGDVVFGCKLAIHLRKPEVVADAQAEAQIRKGETGECSRRRKTVLFFNRRYCIQMGLAIFRNDLTVLIDKDLEL